MLNYQLSDKEKDQLERTKVGIEANEPLPHDPIAMESLCEKGLLRKYGIFTLFTKEGLEMISFLRASR